MIRSDLLRKRRATLAATLHGEPILLMGHTVMPRNYLANPMGFRQDSTFLYYTACRRPGAALLVEGGRSVLFLPEPSPDDALWHGEVMEMDREGASCSADAVRPRGELAAEVGRIQSQGPLHTLPVTDPIANRALRAVTGLELDPARPESGSLMLLSAVIEQRLRHDHAGITEMRAAGVVTRRAHRAAMAATRPGTTELEMQALIEAVFRAAGMEPSYPSIVSVRGEVLHGHATPRFMDPSQLLLVDAGAETEQGYASDVTRTWPVSGTFTPRQRDVYEAVLAAQEAAIAACRPGNRYRDVHLEAARVLARALVDFGLLRGDVDNLVAMGAHAAFFPHGVGHLIGLDVHDMELFGDLAGYGAGRERSEQFGLSYLRLDRDLEPGMAVTIEPGLYLVPAILHDPTLRARLSDSVDWARAETWLPFGGIRIEDDVLVTTGDPELLTPDIPKTVADVEALVGSGAPVATRLAATPANGARPA